MVIPQSSTNLRETSALTAGISPRRLPLRNSVREKLYVFCILLQSSAKPSCRGSNYRIARSGLAIIHSSVSLLKKRDDFCIAIRRTTLQARIKNWASLVRAKVDISICADKQSRVLHHKSVRNQAATYKILLIRTFLEVPTLICSGIWVALSRAYDVAV
jgi:hypothetical protein